jgi:hypothetical protein
LNQDGLWSNRKYYLVDKWEQVLVASNIGSSQSNFQSVYCGDFGWVKKEFSDPGFTIIRDYAPQGIKEIESLSYLHLNTGDRVADVATIKLLYDRMTTPGVIVIDNYSYDCGIDSVDTFLYSKNNIVIPMASGQGIILNL